MQHSAPHNLLRKADSSPGENRKLKVLLRPPDETFQVCLANPSNRVDIRYKRPRYTIGTKNQGNP
jgi:hypothetical protein